MTTEQQIVEQKIVEDLKRQAVEKKLEDEASLLAATAANPGPLRDVFAPKQDILVGPHIVRPFYDVDFEYLQLLDHPFQSFSVGNTEELERFVPRGPKGWQLLWLMTTPVEEVELAFISGIDAVNKAARDKFGRKQMAEFLAIYTAVVKQLTVYASAVVGYDAAPAVSESKDGKDSKGESSVPPS